LCPFRADDLAVRADLPTGTVTFLFTDVEGSTRLLHELGAEAYAEALAEHRRLIREACARHDGVEVDTQGDAFFFAFPTAPGALAAAGEMTEGLSAGAIQVRVGLHTGTPLLTEEGYVGGDVHRAARIAAAGHGGQVLISSSTAQLVELELTDLGEHRLKDLSAPERIFQLADREFPALRSLYRTNLPVPATAFLGREPELAEVLGLLSRDDVRLLTLTGPGGTGKTRLALQAAAEASDSFPDGVFWVPLAPLRDPALVLEAATQALGAKDGFAEHIADKSLLLLFDNFEQVVEAAGEVAGLLGACPNLHVLVTSRERLRVSGEQTWPVPSLAEQDGVELFAARARAVEPSFTGSPAVAELCARLDELPLAIELAAARIKLFTPDQLLARLEKSLLMLTGGSRDLPERQRTLRGAIDWSHDLLDPEDRRLFARLGVFAGGGPLETADAVCGIPGDERPLDVFGGLERLAEQSLAAIGDDAHGDTRFTMLETIREYALEQLALCGDEETTRARHAAWCLDLAEQVAPELTGPDEARWLDRLEAEHDNLHAALRWLLERGEVEQALRIATSVWAYWFFRTHITHGYELLEQALAQDAAVSPVVRADALRAAASFANIIGAHERAHQLLDLVRIPNHLDGELGLGRHQLGFFPERFVLARQKNGLHVEFAAHQFAEN
jgi:predicted ATPase/class 3 adenylate cyclase